MNLLVVAVFSNGCEYVAVNVHCLAVNTLLVSTSAILVGNCPGECVLAFTEVGYDGVVAIGGTDCYSGGIVLSLVAHRPNAGTNYGFIRHEFASGRAEYCIYASVCIHLLVLEGDSGGRRRTAALTIVECPSEGDVAVRNILNGDDIGVKRRIALQCFIDRGNA